MFLFILRSDNSSYYQKLLVLEVFYRITQNPRKTLEFFINYDCDVEQDNILTQIIDILGKIAQGRYRNSGVMPPVQEQNIRRMALETLTNVIITSAAWLDKEI